MAEFDELPENPYLLLTPGPLSTTPTVKATMLRDWCTWDDDYNSLVEGIRKRLTRLASDDDAPYSTVLMQGSGTFCVEATLGTVIPRDGKLLVLANGAYGQRMARIARVLGIELEVHDSGEAAPPDPARLEHTLHDDPQISHVAMVHCETTTGMLNPVTGIGEIVKSFNRTFIIDAMSSFAGIPLTMEGIRGDFLISSANKCIQGVPGFGFIIGRRDLLETLEGQARSLSLDLYDQWRTMEEGGGKWRFTSPTHTVRAFAQALQELDEEGGIGARYERYRDNQRMLVEGMHALGFKPLLPRELQSPIITAFHNPVHPNYRFEDFYATLKARGFVIYPGKVTHAETFRIGTIGDVHPRDVWRLLEAVKASRYWREKA